MNAAPHQNTQRLELIHALDESETLLASHRSAVEYTVDMARDALTALRKGKLHIAEDHLERILERLSTLQSAD